MGKLIDTVMAGSPAYEVQLTDGGCVLISDVAHKEEFNDLVRDLINQHSDEFVILPVSDGHAGYQRAVIVTL